jgi:hypothetical protein
MKLLIVILWFQLVVGLAGLVVSLAGVHTGALGVEWSRHFQAEFERVRAAPDFQSPPEILGISYERLVEWLQSAARDRAEKATYCVLLSGGLALLASFELWVAYRVRHRLDHAASSPQPA